MKNKIDAAFDSTKFRHISFPNAAELYVVDYTDRTHSVRAVEIHDSLPDIDPLTIHNPTHIPIAASIFLPQCFLDETGYEPPQCECVMSPENFTDDAWILFIEIKDCKPGNASNYHKEVKEKIIANVQLFRDKQIIDIKKVVYAVASFPRKGKTNFHHHLIPASEWKWFRDSYKIIIKGTNELCVKNRTQLV